MNSDFPSPTVQDLARAHEAYVAHEPRDLYYRAASDLARLARSGDTHLSLAEAVAVLLGTWNVGYYQFRPARRRALVEDLFRLINEHAEDIAQVEGRSLASLVPEDEELVRRLFTAFAADLDSVGAAKALHLLAPRFFPLWDDKISRAYVGLPSPNRNPGRYWQMMLITKMQSDAAGGEEVHGAGLLKLLDEYNYCRFRLRLEGFHD